MNGKLMKLDGFKIRQFILDVLFPIKCLGCQKESEWLCEKCLGKLKLYNHYSCPHCDSPNANGAVCGYCQKIYHLDGLMVILENNQLTKQLINLVKYNFIVDLVECLEPKLTEYFNKNPWWRDFYVLAPVPLHQRRFLERGFNQSQIICEAIKKIKGNQINNLLLKKIKYHHPQVGLKAKKRQINVVGSFKVNLSLPSDYNKTIVLVDDVYTTGSTLEECAKTLKAIGYQHVWGLVIIRG